MEATGRGQENIIIQGFLGARGAVVAVVVSSPSPGSLRPHDPFFFLRRLDWPSFSLSPTSFPSLCPCITKVMTFQSPPPLQDKALPAQCAEQRRSPVQNVALHPHPLLIRIPHYTYLLPPRSNHHRSVLTHGSSSHASSRFGHPRPF